MRLSCYWVYLWVHGIAMEDTGYPQKGEGWDASLQTRVVFGVNPRGMSLLGREAVTVGAAGPVSRSVWRDSSICACAICGSLGPSRLQREDGFLRGPGLTVLLSRDPPASGPDHCLVGVCVAKNQNI